MKYYFEAFRKYAIFSGRATRSEYWFFYLYQLIAICIIAFFSGLVGGFLGLNESGIEVLLYIYFVASLLPHVAVAVRRLHDTGKSGWWMLLGLVPLINLIVLFFLMEDSQPGPNRYGPNLKGANPLLAQPDAATPTV
jgi:uncharacterized membrane protein YhaH (DUF805 family)